MRDHRPSLLSALAAAAVLGLAVPAQAQDAVAQFYRGKQINLYVGSSAGGGYDTYARLLARRFGSHIPGNPAVLPQNMPGAGSNKLAAFIYSVAPKDGTAAGAILSGAILQPLIGDIAAQHDPSKFMYLGNANVETFICIAALTPRQSPSWTRFGRSWWWAPPTRADRAATSRRCSTTCSAPSYGS